MIATIVTFIMVIGIIGFRGEGKTGGVVACIVVIVLAWLIQFWSSLDVKAWVNRRNYWSMSGKDRAKARHMWEREARDEEERERIRKARRVQGSSGTEETETASLKSNGRMTCIECGGEMDAVRRDIYPSGTVFTRYICRGCGYSKLVNEGKVSAERR